MEEIIILGIRVKKAATTAVRLQSLLSTYGCVIKTRLGLNEIVDDYAGFGGLILLELMGDPNECYRLENELLSMDDIEVRKMNFPKL
ncbi:MAG: hypothetical protein NTU44_15815 [Bacteroidetes bacterium]|nr:hypothetical protein [Bacteroidota bacterium]